MSINTIPLTPARWRRLHPQLRVELRQVLGGKAGILNRSVLDVARDLCARDASLLAWHLYQGLDGAPFAPYQGCGLGLTMDLRTFMGEDGQPWGYGSEETPLLLPRERPRGSAESRELQPEASNRAIGNAVGISHTQVRRDLNPNGTDVPPPASETPREQGELASHGTFVPGSQHESAEAEVVAPSPKRLGLARAPLPAM